MDIRKVWIFKISETVLPPTTTWILHTLLVAVIVQCSMAVDVFRFSKLQIIQQDLQIGRSNGRLWKSYVFAKRRLFLVTRKIPSYLFDTKIFSHDLFISILCLRFFWIFLRNLTLTRRSKKGSPLVWCQDPFWFLVTCKYVFYIWSKFKFRLISNTV